ncbi:MAG: hypothetical protein AAGE80_05470 [Pseudomonadota bacterium]
MRRRVEDLNRAVREATSIACNALGIDQGELARLMRLTVWGSVEGLVQREFATVEMQYVPSCWPDIPEQRALAVTFDHIAIELGDPRRACRQGDWSRR